MLLKSILLKKCEIMRLKKVYKICNVNFNCFVNMRKDYCFFDSKQLHFLVSFRKLLK